MTESGMESGLDAVSVTQQLRKTWSIRFPKTDPAPSYNSSQSVSISTCCTPGEEVIEASFSAGFFGSSSFTSIQLRLIGEMCAIVADAIDGGSA